MKIGVLALDAAARPATDRGRLENVYTAMRPYSPYGPTMLGWKGISPGRRPGQTGEASMADGVMHAVQVLDGTAQLQGRQATMGEVSRAIGYGLRPTTADAHSS